MIKKRFLLLIAGLFSLTSCQEESTAEGAPVSNKLEVVCTTGMISDLVRVIGGDHVKVTNLIGEGIDPHVYKPTATDVKVLLGADLIFYNGLHLEGKMGDVLEKVSAKGKPVYAVAENLLKEESKLTDEAGETDPHLWMDVDLWSKAAFKVCEQLVAMDAENTATFKENFQALLQEMLQLRDYARSSLQTIPRDQRSLITAHDAFGYMERAYGLRVRGIQGLSTESETGLKELEELIEFIIAQNIPAVFVESSVNDKNVKALIEGAKAKGHDVRIGGELFSDAMGPSGSYEGTYIGMIDHNITVITNALGGNAPVRGMQEMLGN